MAEQNLENRIARLEEEVALLKDAWQKEAWQRSQPGPRPGIPSVSVKPAAATSGGRDWFSIETYMGANILGRAGILALLMALAWFIKLAIDRQWINESMRIAIGFAVATGFALWALYLNRARAGLLAQALAGAAFGAFYISVSSAHYFYNLTGLTETFIALALISGGAALLSIRAGSEILYLFSYAGAFAAPLILSRGENSYQFLFSYLTAVQFLFYFVSRKTTLYHSGYLVLVCGYTLFGIWAANRLDESSFLIPFIYLTTLAATLLLHQIDSLHKHPERSLHAPAILTLLNLGAFQFFATTLVERFYPSFVEHQAVLSGGLLFALLVYYRTRIAGPVFALAATITLAALVIFAEGPLWVYILIGLAGSLSLSGRLLGPDSPLVRVLGYLLWPGVLIALFFFLEAGDNRLLWNSRFAAFILAALLALALYHFEKDLYVKRTFAYLALGLLLFAFFKENQDHVYDPQRRNLGYTLILLTASALLLAWGFTRKRTGMRQAGLILASLTALKFFSYDILTLGTGVRIVAGIAVGTGLIIAGLYYQRLQKQAALIFLLLLFLPGDLFAERIRMEGFRFLRPATLPAGAECGQLLLPLDIYRYSSLKELRLLGTEAALPYSIRSVKPSEEMDRLPVRQMFTKTTRNSTIRVYALPQSPPGKTLTLLSMAHPDNENFEASITLEISEDGESWTAAGHHSLYVYGTQAPRTLHVRNAGAARFVRLEISGAPLILRQAFYEASAPPEYSIENVDYTRTEDSDLAATVVRVSGELPVERLELNFEEARYDRTLEVSAYDPEERQFEFLSRSPLRRSNTNEGNHSILLPEAARGDLKLQIFNGSDEPLTISELRLFVPQKEMLFPLASEPGEARLYYGNRYLAWPQYDFDPENCQSWKEVTVGEHQDNTAFAYSLLEPPVSIWLLRALFGLLFSVTVLVGYRAFAGQNKP
ncbi:MAG: DUF2339 domain-containing protein [Spirochaetales bacterium]|nr:DUF2339 domain-containing protein [Spirochaetales bacterium]